MQKMFIFDYYFSNEKKKMKNEITTQSIFM